MGQAFNKRTNAVLNTDPTVATTGVVGKKLSNWLTSKTGWIGSGNILVKVTGKKV